ncbi:MAG: ribonuclease E/G, partial [Christensenellales bacterium]
VVIDFIDMNNSIHIDKIMETLQQELSKDRTKTSIAGMSSLGLVELTRKKKRSMIDAVMLQPCPYCRGNGYVFSDEHVAGKLKNSLNAYFACKDNKALLVTVAPSVFNKIFTARLLEKECENEWSDKRIYMLADPNMHIEKFTIQVLHGSILDVPDNARMLY